MRLLAIVAVSILVAFAPFATGQVRKPLRPPLDAKQWKKTDSGLEIWEVKVGKGDAVKPGDIVVVHYDGWLTDKKATKFDSTLDRGEKAEFPLNGVIQGWQEGIPGMKPGGIRRLKIPAKLAYGEKGAGDLIPGDATLVFEIQLFESK